MYGVEENIVQDLVYHCRVRPRDKPRILGSLTESRTIRRRQRLKIADKMIRINI